MLSGIHALSRIASPGRSHMEQGKRNAAAIVFCASLALTISFLSAQPAGAAVVCVPNTACDASCTASSLTVQGAIDAASAGDTVLVCPGTYPETVTAGHGGVTPGAAGIDINKSLTLKSTGGSSVTTITNGALTPGGHCLPTSCPGGPVQLVTLSA